MSQLTETTIDPASIEDHMRDVTDEEVAFYEEHGWVKLDGLVSRELAAEMLRVGQTAPTGVEHPGNAEALAWGPKTADLFRAYFFSEKMGRNATRLINRKKITDAEVPLLYRADHFICRPPHSDSGTPHHQDSTEHGSDRAGECQFWLALDEVTPEMGAMRFYSGAHRAGPLGAVLGYEYEPGKGQVRQPDLLEVYPKIPEVFPISPPFHYQPGDVTVHHGYMIHGAPPNTTDRPRWSWIYSYTPADTRWPHGVTQNWGSLKRPLRNEMLNPVAWPAGVSS